jgi:hypothetical protein
MGLGLGEVAENRGQPQEATARLAGNFGMVGMCRVVVHPLTGSDRCLSPGCGGGVR